MIPSTIKPVSQQSQPDNSKISIDMAEQIADKAAYKAADETAKRLSQENRENMESFNRFQEQSKQQPVETEQYSRDSIYENEGGYSIDTKTEKNLMRRLLDQTLQKALDPPPPSPIENAVTQVMGQVSAGIAEKMLGNLSGGSTVSAKTGILNDILNTPFGANLGTSFGQSLPQIIQSLTGAIGQQKAQELASAATKVMSQQQTEQQNSSDSSNVENQKNKVLELDINNIDHIKQYASAMGLSEKAAKGMLQIHQDDILSERKSQSTNLNSSNNGSNNNEINQALTILIQEMTGIKQTINALQNKIGGIEDKDIDDDRETSTEEIQQKSVNLFQSAIKVDVDDIKGNADPFFNETKSNLNDNVKANIINKKELEKESVLEEMINHDGKSTFKMSDEKEQPKNVTEKSVVEEKEEDKKKESDSVELIDENVDVTEDKKIEEIPKIEEQKVRENIFRKKIIRKPIPIKKDVSDVPSHITEHYNINNDLIQEDKTI